MIDINNIEKKFDIIYNTIKEIQGHEDAKKAIIYVLFKTSHEIKENKLLYISRKNKAREYAKNIKKEELIFLIIKYCLESFGLRNENFKINESNIGLLSKEYQFEQLDPYKIIELISFSANKDIGLSKSILESNENSLINLISYMMDEKYLYNYNENLKSFKGIIPKMNEKNKFLYFKNYDELEKNYLDFISINKKTF